MPDEHHIPVTRTARYFTLGGLNDNTKNIWILLHGHKTLARDFISHFRKLSEKGSFLIAPEGLMRFYLKGDFGDVGASWMTKEDRQSDISDYVNFLDRLFLDEIEPNAKNHSLKINALGFSQGSATLSRWLTLGKAKVDRAVFWCGSIALDIDYTQAANLKQTEIMQVFASDDPYYDKDFPKVQQELLTRAGLTPQIYTFKGGHEINVGLMKEAGLV
jgi:predicted esterase